MHDAEEKTMTGKTVAKTYFEKLKDPRWQRLRLEVMQRADFKCESCGERTETLHVHHGYYRFKVEPWEYESDTLWCLCEACHQEAEDLRVDGIRFLGRISVNDLGHVLGILLSYRAKRELTASCQLRAHQEELDRSRRKAE